MTTDYVMRLAWDASEELEKTDVQAMRDCFVRFGQRQFGEKVAPALADIYHDYFTTPYIQKGRRADSGLTRSVRVAARSLAKWAANGKKPDQQVLEDARTNLTMYRDSHARFKGLLDRATALRADVPDDRRNFYQFHVLTTLELYMHAFAANESLSRAMLAMEDGNRDSAVEHARTALLHFDKIAPALRKGEYTPWEGWNAGDVVTNVEPTRHALAVCAAALAGDPPPAPVTTYDVYKKIQEYQRPFLKNYPLMYPPRDR